MPEQQRVSSEKPVPSTEALDAASAASNADELDCLGADQKITQVIYCIISWPAIRYS